MIIFMVEYYTSVLFVEINVNVVFVKLLVQCNVFNWCQKMVFDMNYLLLILIFSRRMHIGSFGDLCCPYFLRIPLCEPFVIDTWFVLIVLCCICQLRSGRLGSKAAILSQPVDHSHSLSPTQTSQTATKLWIQFAVTWMSEGVVCVGGHACMYKKHWHCLKWLAGWWLLLHFQ